VPIAEVPVRRLINRMPGRAATLGLGLLPFALVAIAYLFGSHMRLQDNPADKLLPPPAAMADAIERLAVEPSKRSGQRLLWADTAASLQRLGLGVGLSAILGLVFGVAIGVVPYVRATLGHFLVVLSMIPPLAVLPILFIVFGLGEVSKVVLIVIGVAPFLMRDLAARVAELPRELMIKAQTLGASTWQIVTRVVLPQLWPRLIHSVRLMLGPAWLFLIAAEAIAATEGLGYRIFLVRRYLAMDVILPYVAWITLLAFLFDWLLQQCARRAFPWAEPAP
jgi:NitT/TauT family transport system permease protein